MAERCAAPRANAAQSGATGPAEPTQGGGDIVLDMAGTPRFRPTRHEKDCRSDAGVEWRMA
jgi:hypothetical protein